MIPSISILITEPIGGLEDVITEIPLDARISTDHSFSAQITAFPMESGAEVSDHVHLDPDKLSIEGFVSDSPPIFVPNTIALKGDKGDYETRARSKDAFDILQTVWRSRVPVTVVTKFMTYQDMIIADYVVSESTDRGEGLWFTMNLQKLSTVETLAATLPPDIVARLKRRRQKTKDSVWYTNEKNKLQLTQDNIELGSQTVGAATFQAQSAANGAARGMGLTP